MPGHIDAIIAFFVAPPGLDEPEAPNGVEMMGADEPGADDTHSETRRHVLANGWMAFSGKCLLGIGDAGLDLFDWRA